MKRLLFLLIIVLLLIPQLMGERVMWKVLYKKKVNYSSIYPNDVLYLIYWKFKSYSNGMVFRGISTNRKIFKKIKKDDNVYITWDQDPPDFHSVYTFLPKEYDKDEKKHIMIINSMEKISDEAEE